MSSLYIVLFCNFYVTIWCKDNKLIIYLSIYLKVCIKTLKSLSNIGLVETLLNFLFFLFFFKKIIFLKRPKPKLIILNSNRIQVPLIELLKRLFRYYIILDSKSQQLSSDEIILFFTSQTSQSSSNLAVTRAFLLIIYHCQQKRTTIAIKIVYLMLYTVDRKYT